MTPSYELRWVLFLAFALALVVGAVANLGTRVDREPEVVPMTICCVQVTDIEGGNP